jgi:hypothetical protein
MTTTIFHYLVTTNLKLFHKSTLSKEAKCSYFLALMNDKTYVDSQFGLCNFLGSISKLEFNEFLFIVFPLFLPFQETFLPLENLECHA